MKKIVIHIIVITIVMSFLSCEKSLMPYEGKPSIYFNEAGRLPNFSGEVIKDSTLLSFSLAKALDSTVTMVVTTTGGKSAVDRNYTLTVNPLSTAVKDLHYTILNSTFSIKANQLVDTVRIKFFRKADLQANTLLLSFNLQENENFSITMNDKILNANTGKRHSFVNYRWFVNDIIKKPGRWFDYYLGAFSRKKLFLMVDVVGTDPAYMDTTIGFAEMLAYGSYMQRYLNEQRLAGNTILEDDGSVMIMGVGVQ
ncbi:hypothetical protein D3C87_91960 [compost metagenome]